jgi:hypothetical protein
VSFEVRVIAPGLQYWSLHGILGERLDMRTDGRAPTLEAAKAEFEASWRKWLAWARLGELNSE